MKIDEIQELVNIFVPIIVLVIGIFGLFSNQLSDDQAQQLILAGGLSTGLTINKK